MRFSLFVLCVALVAASFLLGCGREAAPSPSIAPVKLDEPTALFQDLTPSSGLDFVYRNGEEARKFTMLETLGGGVGLLDFDGDGLLDVFVAGGGYFDGVNKADIKGWPSKLFKNLGGWKFRDVTDEAGLTREWFYSHGVAVADFDRDGWPDLVVTGWQGLVLLHNEPAASALSTGKRRFRDVTESAGLPSSGMNTSAAWGDVDGDGRPDLYLCRYVDWSMDNNIACGGTAGVPRDTCPPRLFQGMSHGLFRNLGEGRFVDIGKEAGLRRPGQVDRNGKPLEVGKGLGVICADVNNDGLPDFYVANDGVENFLYLNRGMGVLEETALHTGVAFDDQGLTQGSMGVDVADYDGSGWASIFVTNYENELHALYHNVGPKNYFQFKTRVAGLAPQGQPNVGFGTSFVDFDLDGWEDLVVANGHVLFHPVHSTTAQRPALFGNLGKGKFRDVLSRGGSYFEGKHRGRGLAVGDLDNDGRPDLVISHVNGPVALLRNTGVTPGHHWIGLALEGNKHRDLAGTRVTVEVGEAKRTRFIKGGGSYLSCSDPRIVVGLGRASSVDRIHITWSHGKTQTLTPPGAVADRYWRVREGESQMTPWGATPSSP